MAALIDVGGDAVYFISSDKPAIWRLDPESGERELVRDSDGLVVEPKSFRDASVYGRCMVRTPGGSRVFMLDGVPARYDAGKRCLVRAKIGYARMSLIGCATDDVVYVLVDERRIERLDLGTPSRAVLHAEE